MKQGIAFGDHIKTENTRGHRHYAEVSMYATRSWAILALLTVSFLLLIGRIFFLQVIKGNYYRVLSDSNRTRTITIHAPRGIIFDRTGKPLVFNVPGYREIEGEKARVITSEKALDLLSKGKPNIEIDSLREYASKDVLSHVLGYVGQITAEELKLPEFTTYAGKDFVGKSGIEREYEHLLRGTDGKQLVEVDALGKPLRTLGKTDPLSGKDITLTLDKDLQAVVYNAMKKVKKGAVIVSTPTGEILAMVSKPVFDANLFTLDPSYKVSSASSYINVSQVLLDNDNQPLLNRATSGTYPPGSTFKLITAISGLEKNIIDEKYTVEDTGVVQIGTFSFANWYYTSYGRKEPGLVDVTRAIARSNDIFFYRLADKIGVDNISDTAQDFGIGSVTGIDLPGEAKGILPTKEWKKRVIGEQWYLGDNFHYGIGQGFLLTTPLQVNLFTQVVANGGSLYEPRLLKNLKPETRHLNLISSKTRDLVRRGMIESCEPSGVAWPFYNLQIKNAKLKIDGRDVLEAKAASGSAQTTNDMRHVVVACKTGTAQHGDDQTLPHAWITLFAPAYNPQIVVTVLNESSGEGSNEAAPVAADIVKWWFERR